MNGWWWFNAIAISISAGMLADTAWIIWKAERENRRQR